VDPVIQRRLRDEHGIEITIRGIYNFRRHGVSERCAPALAAVLGRTVEEVLRAGGKIYRR
jgi:hypothetical protein